MWLFQLDKSTFNASHTLNMALKTHKENINEKGKVLMFECTYSVHGFAMFTIR